MKSSRQYQMLFYAKCVACDASFSSDSGGMGCWIHARETPIRHGAIIQWLMCARCARWFCLPDNPPGLLRKIWDAGRRPALRREQPFCECGGALRLWQKFHPPWDRVGRDWLKREQQVPCPRCGKQIQLEWYIIEEAIIPVPIGLALLIFGVPFMILTWPFRYLFWVVRARWRGDCWMCSLPCSSYVRLPQIAADGGGTLHRCPRCNAWYDVPATGPINGRKLDPSEVEVRWPEVKGQGDVISPFARSYPSTPPGRGR